MSLFFLCSSCDDVWSVACGITALIRLSRLVSSARQVEPRRPVVKHSQYVYVFVYVYVYVYENVRVCAHVYVL